MSASKQLYVGTVNGENSWFNKSADTYIYSTSSSLAAFGLFKRYMKKFGKAHVTDMYAVNEEKKKIDKIMFDKRW